MARHLMLIRHAEEPVASTGELGVDERGRRDPEALSVRGWQRTGALVRLFAPAAGEPADPRLARPAALYAATDPGKSRRPAATLQPLAQALGVTVNTRYGSEGSPSAFVEELLAAQAPVLVAWRHHALPDLAATLTRPGLAPERWESDSFDRIWVFRQDGEDWRFDDVPQQLLPGDTA